MLKVICDCCGNDCGLVAHHIIDKTIGNVKVDSASLVEIGSDKDFHLCKNCYKDLISHIRPANKQEDQGLPGVSVSIKDLSTTKETEPAVRNLIRKDSKSTKVGEVGYILFKEELYACEVTEIFPSWIICNFIGPREPEVNMMYRYIYVFE